MGLFSSKKPSPEEEEQQEQKGEEQETEQKKKKSYKEQIEENVSFYKMPQNVKLGRPQKSSAAKQPPKEKKSSQKDTSKNKKVEAVSSEGEDSSGFNSTKLVGILIMVGGVIVLGGAIYAGYYYFVAPSLQDQTSPQQSSSESYDPRESEQTNDNQKQQEEKQQEETDQKQQEKKQQEKQQQEDTKEEEVSTTTQKQQEQKDKEKTSTSSTSTAPEFADADDDGLSDVEEELLGTDVNDSDTDGDGYSDQVEIFNLYNPLQGNSAELTTNPNISEYSNSPPVGYSVLYPADWQDQQMNQGESIFLKSGKGVFISIIVESKPRNQTLNEWYTEKYPTSPYKEEPEMIEGDNWKAMPHKNKKIFFLTSSQGEEERRVYVLTLSSEDNKSHHKYSRILRMVLNSFELQ